MSVESIKNRNYVFYGLNNLTPSKLRICETLERHADGLTRHEIADLTRMPLSGVCGRVSELEADGVVESTGETRQTQYGKTATVVRLKQNVEPKQKTLFDC